MSEYDYLKPVTTNGQTTHVGQSNAAQFERQQGWKPAPQQSHESWAAYTTRVNQHGTSS